MNEVNYPNSSAALLFFLLTESHFFFGGDGDTLVLASCIHWFENELI